ncbi:twitch domain-containing radical SAM protein [Synechococcus sp. 1G10]|uniref:twitch domain-containing radical SAM protein n=1 Tax=Synechococcus sp. 1G10 TaxID=2025605 RepID=UPI002100C923|nr:twitch domain-containing radical SAM protein [Synechococcus sp. 1G10]
MLPWMSLHVRTDGKVAACCDFEGELGDVRRDDLRSILDGPAMRDLRLRMLQGETVPGCWRCVDRESRGALSIRQAMNSELAGHVDAVLTTRPDGHAPDARPIYWDIRFSNICNFRCRSCWHGASSRWFADAVKLGRQLGDQAIIRADDDIDRLMGELESFLPAVEEIYFAGGEPLIMEEHFRLLRTLITHGRTDVRLKYSSNLSELANHGTGILDAWRHFPNVRLFASVDAMGARGELIRKDLDWDRFVANLHTVRRHCPHVDRRTLTTVSIFNVLHLAELQRFLHVEFGLGLEVIRLHMLQVPRHYSICVLPAALKDLARDRLRAHLAWIGEHADDDAAGVAHQRRQISAVIEQMDGEDSSALLPKFRRECELLDTVRGECVSATFPELAPIFAALD